MKLKALQKIIICFFVGLLLNLISEQLPDLLNIKVDEQSQFIQGLLDGISTGFVFIGSIMIVIALVSLIKRAFDNNRNKS